jgi:hypothetical protein
VRNGDTAALPHLRGALTRLLQEYPSTFNGLGRTERQIVDILAQSPLNAFDLFAANARREEHVFMGDATLFARIHQLMSSKRPLVAGDPESGPLRLTEHGRRVQAGETDFIELNGLDRWIGGVHLTTEKVWRWDGHGLGE